MSKVFVVLLLVFCPCFHKCYQICRKFACGWQTSKVLACMEEPRFKYKGGFHFARGFLPHGTFITDLLQQFVSGPKTKNKWRPILDLSMLKLFLKSETLKMETTRLSSVEWVTSLDFSDDYFHIAIGQGNN